MDKTTIDYKPTSWPRCRNRQRVAEISINGRRRLCAEAYRDSANGEVICIWPEVYKGRGWRQVGRALPMPAKALEEIIEGYWKWDLGTATG